MIGLSPDAPAVGASEDSAIMKGRIFEFSAILIACKGDAKFEILKSSRCCQTASTIADESARAAVGSLSEIHSAPKPMPLLSSHGWHGNTLTSIIESSIFSKCRLSISAKTPSDVFNAWSGKIVGHLARLIVGLISPSIVLASNRTTRRPVSFKSMCGFVLYPLITVANSRKSSEIFACRSSDNAIGVASPTNSLMNRKICRSALLLDSSIIAPCKQQTYASMVW